MKKHYLSFFFLLFFCGVQAQIFPYFFSVELDGNYTPLSDSISLNNGEIWDDPTYTIPLGFEFDMYDFLSDSVFIVGTNTFVVLDLDVTVQSFILPYISDIIDRGVTSSESEVSYKIEGISGSQIAKIEWKNVGFYGEMDELGTLNNFLSFQLWLYEGSNDIEIHFGPNNIKNDDVVHDVGGKVLSGIVNNYDFSTDEFSEIWFLTGDPDVPVIDTLFTTDTEADFIGLDDDPSDGTIYRFSTSEPTSVIDNYVDQGVKVYPTLVDDYVFIRIEDLDIQEVELMLIDGAGQRILRKEMSGSSLKIDLQNLTKGIYFLHVSTEDGITTKKIIKQ